VAYALISKYFIMDPQFGSIGNLTTFPAVYFALALFITMFGLIDVGIEHVRRFIKVARMQKAWAAEQARIKLERELAEMSQGLTISRRLTPYHHTGFAFSQEAGHDLLVTEIIMAAGIAKLEVYSEVTNVKKNLVVS